jgi:hypothetical protein
VRALTAPMDRDRTRSLTLGSGPQRTIPAKPRPNVEQLGLRPAQASVRQADAMPTRAWEWPGKPRRASLP